MADKGIFAGSGFMAGAIAGLLIPQLLQRGLAAPIADAVAKRLRVSTNGTLLQPKHLYNHTDWESPGPVAGFWVFTWTIGPVRDAPLLAIRIVPRLSGVVLLQMASLAGAPVEVQFDGKVIAVMGANTVAHVNVMA